MGMSVSQDSEDDDVPMSEINTTPLVDVMLVLLIVFMITIPVVTAVMPAELPKTANIETQTRPENINITITADARIFEGMREYANYDLLRQYIISRATEVPQPEVHIRADRSVRFEAVGRTIMAIQRGGIIKVGFITEPPPRG
jgi:biopolymer transport protein ExbD